MNISKRLQQVPASAIRKLVPFADEAKKRGIEVIHLNIGDPDIPIPKVMLERLAAWQGGIPYAHSQGDHELLKALSHYYQELGYNWVSEKEIQVTVGGSEALVLAMIALCDAGDEIIVFEPFFTAYASLAAAHDVTLVPVTTKIETGFHLPGREEIEAKITPKTKAILVTQPNNPTGTVYTQAEMEVLIGLVRERNLFLLSDEVYREIVFSNEKGTSLLDYMPTLPEQLVVLDSLSKRYSAPGLRLGMIVSQNKEFMAGVLRVAMGRLSAGYIDQKVAAQLTKVSHEDILKVRDEYQRRRDVVYQGLAAISGVTMHQPEGAFYCVVQLPVPAEEFCEFLLTKFESDSQTVMLAPMPGFYLTPDMGTNQVRLAYVVGEEKLKRAIELIALALKQFQG